MTFRAKNGQYINFKQSYFSRSFKQMRYDLCVVDCKNYATWIESIIISWNYIILRTFWSVNKMANVLSLTKLAILWNSILNGAMVNVLVRIGSVVPTFIWNYCLDVRARYVPRPETCSHLAYNRQRVVWFLNNEQSSLACNWANSQTID